MDIFLDQPGVQYTVYLGQTKTYGKFDDKFVLMRNFTSKYDCIKHMNYTLIHLFCT